MPLDPVLLRPAPPDATTLSPSVLVVSLLKEVFAVIVRARRSLVVVIVVDPLMSPLLILTALV